MRSGRYGRCGKARFGEAVVFWYGSLWYGRWGKDRRGIVWCGQVRSLDEIGNICKDEL
ncbi:MAG: hypothetical protein KAJ75_05650 [Alphaproteobacteria bacterium]|nr:hypothetical protein [Alphaproteobacteria bacterium]